MTEWEYAYLQANYSPSSPLEKEREFTFCGPTGSTQTVKASSVMPLLNKVGKDGWEAFYIQETRFASFFWLKRPASR